MGKSIARTPLFVGVVLVVLFALAAAGFAAANGGDHDEPALDPSPVATDGQEADGAVPSGGTERPARQAVDLDPTAGEPAPAPAVERIPVPEVVPPPQPSAAVVTATAEPAAPSAATCGPSTATGPVPAGTSAPVGAAAPAEQPSTVEGVDEGNVEPVAPTCGE